MIPLRYSHILILLFLLTFTSIVNAQQQNAPHIGYVYPAGGRQGETFQVTVGGQYLDEEAKAFISGDGIHAKVTACTKPLTQKQVNDLRQKVEELQKKPREPAVTKELMEIRTKISAFRNMMNPGIADKVTLEITIEADADPEPRELRLETANGLSDPLIFQIGQSAEFRKKELETVAELPRGENPRRNGEQSRKLEPEMNIMLPATVNGQIMPGEVDRYRFHARKGQQLVVAVSARELIPYLADAVPGWFQAVAAIYDANGNELAYDDNYRFHPDPVLSCKIPKDGSYVLEIRDALYRGREDFVYRIGIGELPFVTSVFPLGGLAGEKTAVELKGWNLPQNKLSVDAKSIFQKSGLLSGTETSGVLPLTIARGKQISNRLPFAIDSLPECLEQEPNNEPAKAQAITLPIIINGRIDPPGDRDVFRIEGIKGQKIVAEVDARKLGSPLDSVLKLTDADGRQLAFSDDYADKGEGLSTHHADSYLTADLPAKGVYYLSLGDSQHKGGAEYAYRLRVSEPQPDFALRMVPSSVNVRAGGSVPITVYALRRDGFSADINLSLKDAPNGFKLSGGSKLPAGQDQIKLTLSAPQVATEEPFSLTMEGRAAIGGREIMHRAVPAEDMMQAFIYHHHVSAKNSLVAVTRRVPPRLQLKYLGENPLRISAGQTATLQFSGPRGPTAEQMQLALKDSPDGITIQKVSTAAEGITLVLQADAEKVKPGQKGNLLIEAFVERAANPDKGKPTTKKRRVSLGTLPAVPYETLTASEKK
jgi:hypothetical protein